MSHELSPELVLIDPTLGDVVRPQLPEPQDTLARVDALIQSSRMAALGRLSIEEPARRASGILRPAQRRSRAGRPKFVLLGGTTVAGLLVVALLVGVRVDLNGNPAGADVSVPQETAVPVVPQPPNPGGGSEPRGERKPPKHRPEPQRFAWAPVADASAYHVELFRGSAKVFEAETTQPAITIPTQWTFGERTHSLEPADYRWIVWPVRSGVRAARAVVQAKLTIPAG